MIPKDTLRRLPKAELHVHLDGSLRPGTMLELADERGIDLPVDSAEALARWMVVDDAGRLEDYLARFEHTLAVMQDAAALERTARELVLDHVADGVWWLEARFCPHLNTRRGLTPSEVLDAVLRGLRAGEAEAAAAGDVIAAAVIVCGLRTHDPGTTEEAAELATAYAGRGVCGFDLAGAEAGHPVADHIGALNRAHAAGLPVTLHAGEGYGPASIRQALELGHARRIGHGTRLEEDPDLLDRVRALGTPLEMCLTSNLQTRVVPSLDRHPAGRYHRAGIRVCLSTDNRLMSGVSLTDEYGKAAESLGLTWAELVAIARNGFEAAFVDEERRGHLLTDFDRVAAELPN